ncbi:MAG: DUF3987 domain-containing protein [Clostridia bacterium]|nr:DUF3987 domain-containing protein [Clostridia bacterium]
MTNEKFANKIKNSEFFKDYKIEIKKAPENSEANKLKNIIPEIKDVCNINKWGKPVALDYLDIPEFPIECYPKEISEFLKALSISTQTSQEMCGILALGILAVCNQGNFVVRIKPEYYESLSLYTIAVAEPGERKSAVINIISKPIFDFVKDYNTNHKNEIAKNEAIHRSLQRLLEETEKKFSKNKASLEDVEKAATSLADFKVKSKLKITLDNTTTEKLIDLMQEQNGRISIISSEGGILKNFGSDYKKDIDIDPYLKAHDGDSISFERINRPANYIENPALSIVIGIQPERIKKFVNNKEYKECGLVARFLIVFCQSMQGYRDINPPSIPKHILENYDNLIKKMLKRTAKNKNIFLSQEAKNVYYGFQVTVEKKLSNEWFNIRDFAAKIPGTMLRIAGLLHCAKTENPDEENINKKTIEEAINIIMYIAKHIEKIYQINDESSEISKLKYVLKRIKKINNLEFDKQELYQICKGSISKAEHLDEYLKILENYNYLKIINIQTEGRPKQKIILNPIIKHP